MGLLASANVNAADWKKIPAIGANPASIVVEVDLASRRIGRTLWIRITLGSPDRDGVLYSLIQNEVDCPRDRIRALNATMYDKDHRPIDRLGRKSPEAWRLVPPEPGLDLTILNIGCRRARLDGEAPTLDEFLDENKTPKPP
jgi:hypothetical protein